MKFRITASAAILLLLSGCAGLPEHIERSESHALRDTQATRLGQAEQKLLQAHPGESGFLPLVSAVDALLARIALANVVERSLDLQYYIWHDDVTGRHIVNAALSAADRGVRVRILLDDHGVQPNDETLLILDAHPNIEIRLFNPVALRSYRNLDMLLDFSRLNRRMHNKAFIADNRIAVLGGRNIGDEYFGANSDVVFGDLDVMTVGPGVSDVSESFDRFWNAPVSIPVAALLGHAGDIKLLDNLRKNMAGFVESQHDSPFITQAKSRGEELLAAGAVDNWYWGKAQVLYDDPAKVGRDIENIEGHLLPQLSNLTGNIEKELLIVSPYFVPGGKGVDWFANLAKRGVRVTVLTNSLAATDVSAVYAGYQRYREALLEAGVKLYELKPQAVEYQRVGKKYTVGGSSSASLHAKSFVFDRQSIFIGSLNLDPRSVQLNTEIGVVCESKLMAETMASQLEQHIDNIAWRLERVVDSTGESRVVWTEPGPDGIQQFTVEPGVGFWKKFSVWFMGMLPIESQI